MTIADDGKSSDDSGGISLAESMLSNKKDDLDDEDDPKDEDKSKIDFWAKQDPDGSKKKALEEKKAKDLEKKKKEDQEKEIQQKMDNLSAAEKNKLRHEALQGATQELRKKKEEEESAADVDELQGDWE